MLWCLWCCYNSFASGTKATDGGVFCRQALDVSVNRPEAVALYITPHCCAMWGYAVAETLQHRRCCFIREATPPALCSYRPPPFPHIGCRQCGVIYEATAKWRLCYAEGLCWRTATWTSPLHCVYFWGKRKRGGDGRRPAWGMGLCAGLRGRACGASLLLQKRCGARAWRAVPWQRGCCGWR